MSNYAWEETERQHELHRMPEVEDHPDVFREPEPEDRDPS